MDKIDPRYTKGKIYTIKCINDNSKIYVGSTIQTLAKRLGKHKEDSKKERCKNIILYKNINNKWDNWFIELYENYSCNNKKQLLKREGEIIREIGNLNKVIAGRTRKEYVKDNQDKFNKYYKKRYEDNKEEFLEKSKERYHKNFDIISEKAKKYRETLDKEVLAEKNKQWRIDNREVLIQKNKIYYETNKEILAEKQKIYYETLDKEVLAEYHKQYRIKNKEVLKQKKKQYYESNKEEINKKNIENYNNNKEKCKERNKIYHETNKEKRKEKITCECCSVVSRGNLTDHKKTKKHIELMQEKMI